MRAENSALICWKLYSAYRYLEILDSYVSLYIREERKNQLPSSIEVVTKKLKNEKRIIFVQKSQQGEANIRNLFFLLVYGCFIINILLAAY